MKEDIFKKNPRERLKAEKHPIDIIEDLTKIIEQGYEETLEEDLVRLQWYGLYHDKPRVGKFLLRIKVSGGVLTPEQLRTIGELAKRFGNYAELTLRQDVQLHYIELNHLPDVFEKLRSVDLFPVGACGDTVRNITTCPLSGLDEKELFDVRKYIYELENFFHCPDNREYFNLPRKFKITMSSCPYHCNMPEMHDLAFVGMRKDGKDGFAVWVGGGLSSTPRIAKGLGWFIPAEKVLPFAKAVVDVWSQDWENRKSFVKARFKYMVDRLGVESIKERLLERLDFLPEDIKEEPKPLKRCFHTGLGKQKDGLYYLGVPVVCGRTSGDQLLLLADLCDRYGISVRLSQRQNFILANLKEENVDEVKKELSKIGLPTELSEARSVSVACTSDPFCNYSVGSAKEALKELLDYLESELGSLEGISIGVDGCPHACAHHWLNDIGLQATHRRCEDGSVETTYNLVLGGGYGKHAGIGKIVLKKVPLEKLKVYLKNIVSVYRSSNMESFCEFVKSLREEDLINFMEGSTMGVKEIASVRIRIFGPLTRFSGGLSEVEVSASTVRQALELLEMEFEGFKGWLFDNDGKLKPFVKVFLNEEDIEYLNGLDTELKEGNELMLYPALAGGSFDEQELYNLAVEYEDRPAEDVIKWALENFHPKLYLAWSGQAEDMVLLHMAWEINPNVRVFTVDTGRLHEETYKLMQDVEERYGVRIEVYFPDQKDVEEYVRNYGINGFYRSVQLRHLCCQIRKVKPLLKALFGVDAWITGLRREQWASRHNIMKIEVDHDHGQIVKVNPLADWTEKEVWDYIRKKGIPYNELYRMGYRSIGCAPCTRSMAPYENPREGRWWWEKDAPKECGMHCSIETGGFEKIAEKLLKEESTMKNSPPLDEDDDNE